MPLTAPFDERRASAPAPIAPSWPSKCRLSTSIRRCCCCAMPPLLLLLPAREMAKMRRAERAERPFLSRAGRRCVRCVLRRD